MPKNKNALIRYLALDKCFSNKYRKFHIDMLLEEVNKALQELAGTTVSKRQIYDDIKFMESEEGFSAPITKIKEGKRVYYRYEDPNFSIRNTFLNEEDIATLKVTLNVLSKFDGIPYYKQIENIINKLQKKLNVQVDGRRVINFDLNIDLVGIDYIDTLFYAIVHKQVLKVEYENFQGKYYELIFHPQYLKQYNRRWFCIGYVENDDRDIWLLALDRVKNIHFTGGKYVLKNIDWEEEYFYDIVGVTRFADESIQKVELLFSKELAPYIRTKPLHPTQVHKFLDDGRLHVYLNVIPNYELESLILSFGEDVEVLSPVSLREKISERLIRMLNKYE